MTLPGLIARLGVVVGGLLLVAAVAIVGPRRLARLRIDAADRARRHAPYVAGLALVLLLNSGTRKLAPELSWVIGLNITGAIYALEGAFVAHLQSLASPPLTAALAFVYVYGYVFLLCFPLLAYFALEDLEPFRETCLAYGLNYGGGLVCYVVFIAYGPRNLMPDLVDPLLYASWPEAQLLTSQVNTNTNVFPSLHSSLAVTVGLLAWRTRAIYPAWTPIAALLGGSVLLSTMYLGIHWALDVVAGALLGVGSVAAAVALRERAADRSRRPLVGVLRVLRAWLGAGR